MRRKPKVNEQQLLLEELLLSKAPKSRRYTKLPCYGLFTISNLDCHKCVDKVDCDNDFMEEMGYKDSFVDRLRNITGDGYMYWAQKQIIIEGIKGG